MACVTTITATVNGKAIDTSMGFTPLDGLAMGTRCGQVDAGAITYIGEKEGMSLKELDTMMNKKHMFAVLLCCMLLFSAAVD